MKIKKFLLALKGELEADQTFTGAAALSYYLLLATFPAAIALLSIISFLPIENVEKIFIELVRSNMPGSSGEIIATNLKQIITKKSTGMLSFGFLAAFWAASSGMAAIIQQLNVSYDIKENESFLIVRLRSLFLIITYIILIGLSTFAAFRGTDVINSYFPPFNSLQIYLVTSINYFFSFLITLLALAILYFVGPKGEREFEYITPGSIAGAFLLILATICFDFYVSNFGNYQSTYGSLGGIIAYMLWLYIAGFIILFGAQINSLYKKFNHQAV